MIGIPKYQLPCSGLSSHESEIIGGSPIRTFTRDIILQLDGPTSVRTRGRALENVRAEQETILKIYCNT